MKIWILVVGLILTTSCTTLTPSKKTTGSPIEPKICEVVRGTFDVGSASTRMKVAQVDRCKNKVLKILLEREEKIGFKEDLIKSPSKQFSQKTLDNAEEVLKKLKAEADPLGAKEYQAVFTSAFRDAKNAKP